MYNYTTMNNAIIENNAIVTTRKVAKIEGRRNKATCAFPDCTCKVKPSDGARIVTPSHQRGITLCDTHLSFIDDIDSFTYSQENHEHVGTQTAKGITTSFELETIENTRLSLASMVCDLHFDATHDCTLRPRGIEHKSPIFDSLQPCTKTLGTIEYLNTVGAFDTTADCCGAHIHTGFYGDPVDFRNIYENVDDYMHVFGGLYRYLENMPNAKMHEYFGRGFTDYARTILKNRSGFYYMPCHDGNGRLIPDDKQDLWFIDTMGNKNHSHMVAIHSCAFNLQHSYSIEFRLPKFVNAVQYRHCILTMQDLTAKLRDCNFRNCSDDLVAIFAEAFPY